MVKQCKTKNLNFEVVLYDTQDDTNQSRTISYLQDEDTAVGKVEILVVVLLVTVVADDVDDDGVVLDVRDELLVVSLELVTATSNY